MGICQDIGLLVVHNVDVVTGAPSFRLPNLGAVNTIGRTFISRLLPEFVYVSIFSACFDLLVS